MQCNPYFSEILAANQFLKSDVMSLKNIEGFGKKSIILAVMRIGSWNSQIVSVNQLN